MTWGGKQWTFQLIFGLDLFCAAIFFSQFGLSVSTMSGLVRNGKDAPLKLWRWQRAFLRWLEPRLSRAHCAGALSYDLERAHRVIQLLS